MLIADKWKDFELIDAGNGYKLERWGEYVLSRPDPQAIWPRERWKRPDAEYSRSSEGGGNWKYFKSLPGNWTISYPAGSGKLTFGVEPTGFKHTGIFPEQAVNWDFFDHTISKALSEGKGTRILNLFAYTGAATAACLLAGASEVVHVDASKGMNEKAKINLELSSVRDRYVRFITEDVNKFTEREIRRGRKYDGIIMDPPAYGRGPGGELWKLEDSLYPMVEKCTDLLSEDPLFFVINSYTTGYAPSVLSNVLELALTAKFGGNVFSDELGLKASARNIILPCGATGRWSL